MVLLTSIWPHSHL